jgi:hypothetical protein
MILWARSSLASFFAAAAVAATGLAWRASSQTCPPAPPAELQAPRSESQVLPAPEPDAVAPTPEAIAAGDDGAADMTGDTDAVDPPGAGIAGPGDVATGWIPRSYLRDVTPDEASTLTTLVNGWLAGDEAPRIEYRRGVVRVRSDEDRGDEPPYPRSAFASGERICGEPSTWMREALRDRLRLLAPGDLTCSQNVCSYRGQEYAPTGYLIFHSTTYLDEPTWVLDAWVEVYQAALVDRVAAKNATDVVRLLKRVAPTSCPGEPAGMY